MCYESVVECFQGQVRTFWETLEILELLEIQDFADVSEV